MSPAHDHSARSLAATLAAGHDFLGHVNEADTMEGRTSTADPLLPAAPPRHDVALDTPLRHDDLSNWVDRIYAFPEPYACALLPEGQAIDTLSPNTVYWQYSPPDLHYQIHPNVHWSFEIQNLIERKLISPDHFEGGPTLEAFQTLQDRLWLRMVNRKPVLQGAQEPWSAWLTQRYQQGEEQCTTILAACTDWMNGLRAAVQHPADATTSPQDWEGRVRSAIAWACYLDKLESIDTAHRFSLRGVLGQRPRPPLLDFQEARQSLCDTFRGVLAHAPAVSVETVLEDYRHRHQEYFQSTPPQYFQQQSYTALTTLYATRDQYYRDQPLSWAKHQYCAFPSRAHQMTYLHQLFIFALSDPHHDANTMSDAVLRALQDLVHTTSSLYREDAYTISLLVNAPNDDTIQRIRACREVALFKMNGAYWLGCCTQGGTYIQEQIAEEDDTGLALKAAVDAGVLPADVSRLKICA